MENASKALIIAGAILLAIAIIGIGMYVFTSASSQVSDANLSKEQIQVFNSKFERFEGEQTGKQLKLLLDVLRTHNLTQDSLDMMIKVQGLNKESGSVSKNWFPTNWTKEAYIARFDKSKIVDSDTYSISFKYNDGTDANYNNKGALGTISCICIKPAPDWR